ARGNEEAAQAAGPAAIARGVDLRGVRSRLGPAMEDTSGLLGPLEADVMRVLWAARTPLSVRAVLDELNRRRSRHLAYPTVITVMARLADKGVLRRHRDGRGYLYEATVTDAAGIAVRGV